MTMKNDHRWIFNFLGFLGAMVATLGLVTGSAETMNGGIAITIPMVFLAVRHWFRDSKNSRLVLYFAALAIYIGLFMAIHGLNDADQWLAEGIDPLKASAFGALAIFVILTLIFIAVPWMVRALWEWSLNRIKEVSDAAKGRNNKN